MVFPNLVERGAAQQPLATISADSRNYILGDNGLCLHGTLAEAMHAMPLATPVGLFEAFYVYSGRTYGSESGHSFILC